MSREMLAVLMSALVCPGTGQLMLGRRRGWAFAAASFAAVAALAVCVISIFMKEVPVETFYAVDYVELMKIYARVRARTYVEAMPVLLVFLLIP